MDILNIQNDQFGDCSPKCVLDYESVRNRGALNKALDILKRKIVNEKVIVSTLKSIVIHIC